MLLLEHLTVLTHCNFPLFLITSCMLFHTCYSVAHSSLCSPTSRLQPSCPSSTHSVQRQTSTTSPKPPRSPSRWWWRQEGMLNREKKRKTLWYWKNCRCYFVLNFGLIFCYFFFLFIYSVGWSVSRFLFLFLCFLYFINIFFTVLLFWLRWNGWVNTTQSTLTLLWRKRKKTLPYSFVIACGRIINKWII